MHITANFFPFFMIFPNYLCAKGYQKSCGGQAKVLRRTSKSHAADKQKSCGGHGKIMRAT